MVRGAGWDSVGKNTWGDRRDSRNLGYQAVSRHQMTLSCYAGKITSYLTLRRKKKYLGKRLTHTIKTVDLSGDSRDVRTEHASARKPPPNVMEGSAPS